MRHDRVPVGPDNLELFYQLLGQCKRLIIGKLPVRQDVAEV